MSQYDIRKLTPEEFPAQLLEIPQPPKELWLAGAPLESDTTYLTVVGSRKYSEYGKEACQTIIAGLSGYDITIVSGLALGIDGIAHEAAMHAGLRTIAVPGSGLDPKVIYPRTHLQLAERIIKNGGGLLSEYSPDTPAALWTFPQRNRIMAGLSQATLLIEASEKSGTLITARLALDYNRDVLVVPGNIFSPTSYGTHQFLKLGATPITTPADVLLALGFNPRDDDFTPKLDFSDLNEMEQKVMEALTSPKYRDVLIEELDLSASDGNIIFMKMEIAGLIKETGEGLRRA